MHLGVGPQGNGYAVTEDRRLACTIQRRAAQGDSVPGTVQDHSFGCIQGASRYTRTCIHLRGDEFLAAEVKAALGDHRRGCAGRCERCQTCAPGVAYLVDVVDSAAVGEYAQIAVTPADGIERP